MPFSFRRPEILGPTPSSLVKSSETTTGSGSGSGFRFWIRYGVLLLLPHPASGSVSGSASDTGSGSGSGSGRVLAQGVGVATVAVRLVALPLRPQPQPPEGALLLYMHVYRVRQAADRCCIGATAFLQLTDSAIKLSTDAEVTRVLYSTSVANMNQLADDIELEESQNAKW